MSGIECITGIDIAASLGILESSIKITNEPPTGMFANLHKSLNNFNQDTLEMCAREAEFKVILFSLCYFHAVVSERQKFGPQGWNRSYPFNTGDLTISVNVLYNYLEANTKVCPLGCALSMGVSYGLFFPWMYSIQRLHLGHFVF